MSLVNGDGKKDLSSPQQKTLLDIATIWYKKLNESKGDDPDEDIESFQDDIRRRLTSQSVSEDEIINILDQNNSRYGGLFLEQGNSSASIFHRIMKYLKSPTDGDREDKSAASRLFLQHLVISYPDVLTHQNDGDLTPLDLAARKNKFVVFLITDLVVPDETLSLLRRKCEKATSRLGPNTAVKQGTARNCAIELHRALVRRFRRPGKFDDTACLHDLIDERKLAESDRNLRQILKKVLLGDEANENRSTCLHSLLEDETVFALDDAGKVVETFQRLIRLCPKPLMGVCGQDGLTPLHKAIRLYSQDNINFELLNKIIVELFKRSPESLYETVQGNPKSKDYSKSPYALLEDMKPQPPGPNTRGNKSKCYADIKRILKYACIGGNRARDQKREYLYGEQENAPKLFLDLEYVSGGVNKRYLETLSEKVNQPYDTALVYVRLPQIQQKSKEQPTAGPDSLISGGKAPGKTRIEGPEESNPYSQVFDWLYKRQKVEKIFNVIVDDLGDRSHSDEAIIKALNPFDVEVWDWMKFDMCSSTIEKAAPNLEEITITMYPGKRESRETLQLYLKDFMTAFSGHRLGPQPKITFRGLDDLSMSRPLLERSIRSSSTGQQSEDVWITNLTPFSEALDSWFGGRSPSQAETDNGKDDNGDDGPLVKIALIDNGVNVRHPEVANIIVGESFYDPSSSNGFRDFFADPSTHGTQMAICIRKVCPMAKLYVARLDDSKGEFTVASALQALDWAIKKGVDIISMSWTFNQTKPQIEKERAEFKEAISRASSKNILLFAALNDAEPNSDMGNFYPVGLEEVFKIGSSKKWGAAADFGQKNKSDYLFPGQDITLEDPDGEALHPSGSSLATAFAAGMAGLILYSMKVHLITPDSEVTEEVKAKRLADAKTRAGMVRIFNVLGDNLPKTVPKDIPVAFSKNLFPQTISTLVEDKTRTLREFIQRIAPTYSG
ncbi:hypothetical protein Hte_005965 [Hypoxylon texense]